MKTICIRQIRNEGKTALVFSFLALSILLVSGCFSKESVILDKPVLVINGQQVSTKQ